MAASPSPPPPGVASVPASPTPASPAGAAAQPAAPESRPKAVKAFFFQLRKGVRQLAMYPNDPARLAAASQSLLAPLGALLASGPVAIGVQAEAFTFEREPVWAAEGTDNTPGHFHEAGVRSLLLRPGLFEPELSRLLSILLTRPDKGGEDIGAQLFNAAFEHLSFALTDSYAFGGLTEAQVEQELHARVAELERRHLAATPALRAHAVAACQALDQKLAALEDPRAPRLAQGQVVPAFVEKAQKDAAQDLPRRLAPQLVAQVVGLLRGGALRDPGQASELLARLVDAMLRQGDLSPLPTLFDSLEAAKTPESEKLLAALGARLGEEARLKQLAPLLNAPRPAIAPLARYLAECRTAAAGPLVALLPGIAQRPVRLMVLEAAAALDKDAGAALADRLEVEGTAVVGDLLSLVERLPAAERGKLFDRAIHHSSAEVRIAALEALVHTSTPEAMHRFVLDATRDASAQVRAAAFRSLVKLSPVRASADLLRLPKLPDWDKRSAAEKELVFECLGRTETGEAFAYATSLLQVPKKGLFGGKRVELKLLAVRALQHMPNLQSFKALQGVGAIADQDPEATAAAQKAVPFVKEAMLGAAKAEEAAAAPAEPPAVSAEEVARALELIKRRIAARVPAPVPAAPPPPAAAAAQPAGEPDPLLEYPEPAAPPPPWATPAGDTKSGGGR